MTTVTYLQPETSSWLLFWGGTISGPQAILRFGVLQLRVHRFRRLHFRVLRSKVQHLHILQDGVRALFLLQAKVIRVVVTQFGLLWLKVLEFGLLQLRVSWNFALKPKLLRIVIQKSRAFLESSSFRTRNLLLRVFFQGLRLRIIRGKFHDDVLTSLFII